MQQQAPLLSHERSGYTISVNKYHTFAYKKEAVK